MRFKVIGKEFERIVKFLNDVTDDVKFVVDGEEVNVNVINREKTMFAKIKLVAIDTENGSVAVRVDDLKKVAKLFKKDEIEFSTTSDNWVIVKGEKKKMKIPIVDVEEQELEFPEFQFTGKFTMSKKEFKEFVSNAKDLGNAIKIKDGKAEFVNDQYEFEMEIDSFEGTGRVAVAVQLLQTISKLDADEYVIEIGNDLPMKVTAKSTLFEAEILVAPLVEEE